MKEFTREQWADAVAEVISLHPEWVAATVNAVQAGILEANERLRDRVADVSMGLHQALITKPGHVKRRHDVIVRAIEASTLCGSKWADETIARESQ